MPQVISGSACLYLFCFWVISLPIHLLSVVFIALTTCACHTGCRVSVQTTLQDFPHVELFWALQRHSELRFEPAWSSVGSMHAIHPLIAPSFLPVLCPCLAHCAVP
jgi:hypothetical protein